MQTPSKSTLPKTRPLTERVTQPVSDKPSLTQQQFKEAVDVNNIVANLKKGIMPLQPKVSPTYGDVSNVDYLTMLNTVADVDNIFSRLPAKLRAQFHNSPLQMVRWLNNPENREKAIKMGLLKAAPEEPDYKAIMEGKDTPPKADPESQPNYSPKGGEPKGEQKGEAKAP